MIPCSRRTDFTPYLITTGYAAIVVTFCGIRGEWAPDYHVNRSPRFRLDSTAPECPKCGVSRARRGPEHSREYAERPPLLQHARA